MCSSGTVDNSCEEREACGLLVLHNELPTTVDIERDNIVHVKGFGEEVLVTEEYDDDLLAKLSEAVGEGVVCWDGDLFHEQSFTRVVDKLLSSTGARGIAFSFQRQREKFEMSWCHRVPRYNGGLCLVLLDDSLMKPAEAGDTLSDDDHCWVELGLAGLRMTRSKRVFALGGGGVAAKELERGEGAHWSLFRLPRGVDSDDFGSLYRLASTTSLPNVEIHVPNCNGVFS